MKRMVGQILTLLHHYKKRKLQINSNKPLFPVHRHHYQPRFNQSVALAYTYGTASMQKEQTSSSAKSSPPGGERQRSCTCKNSKGDGTSWW